MRTSRMILRIIILLVGSYLILFTVAWLVQSRLVYFPTKTWRIAPAALGFEELNFAAADGVKLSAWFSPAPQARGVILICHGNGGNVSHRAEMMLTFNRLGYSAMCFDYRGYGHSEGSPDEQGTYADARAAWDYLLTRGDTKAADIVIYGESLGGGVAAHLAAGVGSCRALVLQSTFSSLTDVAAHHYWYLPVRWLLRFRYPSAEHAQKVTCPVLVIHSPEDEIVPYKFGRKLFEAAHEPKAFLEIHGGHNDGCDASGSIYTEGLSSFLKSCQNN
ncbi:MAG: alpha/beta hydrolase [Planctomycetaceae bacterium]|nr:alpha/beta hydrolase [Planctomycetaceae bacterium]